MASLTIERYSNPSASEFLDIYSKNEPVILTDIDIGACKELWTIEYLSESLANNIVKIHSSKEPRLDFITKNFTYKTMTFPDFISKCAASSSMNNNLNGNSKEEDKNGDLSADDQLEYLYLRSLGLDKRGRDVANLPTNFPEISKDFKIPECIEQFANDQYLFFSSVLRIASSNLNLWTHYDMMDNLLINIKGRKRIVLFSPDEALNLYLIGDKSPIVHLDINDQENLTAIKQKYPKFLNAKRYECTLNENEAIFLPALWFHNVLSLDFNISVNIFWKDHQVLENYDKNDVYGNRDLVPALNAYANIDKAIKHLSQLPDKYKNFYLDMLINKISLARR